MSATAGIGLIVVMSGQIEVTQNDRGEPVHIATHERGNFMGELAQLSGRPYLVDATALTDVEALAIPPERLRALLIAEADLGERIMRALILRRVGLIEAGAGPIIVGPEGNADVLRLVNFLRRNGHPYQQLDPANDTCAATLVDRFQVVPEELPVVLCPAGELLRNPSEAQIGALHRAREPGQSRQALRCRDHRRRPRRPCHRRLCRLRRPVGAGDRLPLVRRPGRRLGADRELPRLPDRHLGHGADGPGVQPGAEVRGRDPRFPTKR